MPGDFRCDLTNACALYHAHCTRGYRAHRAPGIPCALLMEGKEFSGKPRADQAARSRSCVFRQRRRLKMKYASVVEKLNRMANAKSGLPKPYGLFFSPAAAGAAAGTGAGAALLLPAPNNSLVGLRSRLFTARLMSPRVRRPSVIKAPERLSKSSASSRIDFTAWNSSPPSLPPASV